MNRPLLLILFALSLAECSGGQNYLTVSEVWENAETLNGKRIRVRGRADFWLSPYHPMQIGGCIPDEDAANKSHIVGKLALFDENAPDSTPRLFISESSLQCEGDVCSVVCKPFAPASGESVSWGISNPKTIEAFEFVGKLRTRDQQDSVELILEDIDLKASRQLIDGEWGPIPTGDFTYNFP